MRKRISSAVFAQFELSMIHQTIIDKSQDPQVVPERKSQFQAITQKVERLMGLRPSHRYGPDINTRMRRT